MQFSGNLRSADAGRDNSGHTGVSACHFRCSADRNAHPHANAHIVADCDAVKYSHLNFNTNYNADAIDTDPDRAVRMDATRS